jgi:hypothetical protein
MHDPYACESCGNVGCCQHRPCQYSGGVAACDVHGGAEGNGMRTWIESFRRGHIGFNELMKEAESALNENQYECLLLAHKEAIGHVEDNTVTRLESMTARWVLVDAQINTAVAFGTYRDAEEAAYQKWSRWLPEDLMRLNPESIDDALDGDDRFGQIGAHLYAFWNYLDDQPNRVLLLCEEGNEGVGLGWNPADRDYFAFDIPTFDMPASGMIRAAYLTAGKPSGEVVLGIGFTLADTERWTLT